jgi:hypothetical protein
MVGGWCQPGTPNTSRPKPRGGKNARLILHTLQTHRHITLRQLQAMHAANDLVLAQPHQVTNATSGIPFRPKLAQPISHGGIRPGVAAFHGLRLALCCAQRARRSVYSPSSISQSANLKAARETARQHHALIIKHAPLHPR